MIGARADWLPLRAKLLTVKRALGAHWFSVVVLAPMIVAGFYFILEPNVVQAGGWLRRGAPDWTGADLAAAGFLLSAALVAAGLPSALRHAYALGLPEAYLDALPISADARFRALLAGQLLRNVPAWIGLAAIFHLLASEGQDALLPSLGTTLTVILEVAALQILTALTLVHRAWLRPARLLAIGASIVLICVLVRFEPLAGLLLLPLLPAASFFQAAMVAALEVDLVPSGWLSQWPAQAAGALAIGVLAWGAYRNWRDAEVERAEEAIGRKAFTIAGLDALLRGRFGAEVGAQLARDLRLTLRAATPAVWTCSAAALLFLGAMPTAIVNRWAPEQWMAVLLLTLTGLAVFSLSAIAPVLLQRQAPALWTEHASGVSPEDMLKARKYFTLIVSFPAAVLACAVLPLYPGSWGAAVWFAARAALAWISVSTMVGAAAFDVAAAPGLGLMLMGLASAGVCGMYGFNELFPIGLFLYAYLMHHLSERAESAAARLGEQV